MDLFDDDKSGAPAACARPRAKFVPKAKFKQPPQKKISASEHATSSTTSKDSDGIYQNECHNAVAGHPLQVEQLQNMEEDTSNSIMGNPQEVSVNRDTAPLVGDLPFTTAASEDVADQPFSNFPQLASEADSVELEAGSATKSIPEIDFNNGKPTLNSLNEKGVKENLAIPACSSINSFGACDTTQVQRCSEYHTTQDSQTFNEVVRFDEDDSHTNNSRLQTQEVVALNHGSPVDIVYDHQCLQFGNDPTYNVSMHEELTNPTDCPTLADSWRQDLVGEKEDGNERKNSPKKHSRSFNTHAEDGGKTSRQVRKQAARKATNSLNEDDDHLDPPYNSIGDEHEETDDEYGVDNSPKKKRATRSSKEKKPIAKNVKATKKRKKANDDSEKTAKEPPEKFSHSSRRRKTLDKALLEIDQEDYPSLPLRLLISVAEHKELLTKKEAKSSSMNKSSGRDLFQEADANDEEENFGSEDGSDLNDDQASKRITSTEAPLLNYGAFSNKAPRAKWSKQETELFYVGIRGLGTNFSMIKLLFPNKTCHQVQLKFKNEDRKHPLQISDAIKTHATDPSHFQLVFERLQGVLSKAEQDPSRDASEFAPGEEVEDLTPGTNEEAATAMEDDTDVKDKEDSTDVKDKEDSTAFHSPEQSDDSDDDLQDWSHYKSDF